MNSILQTNFQFTTRFFPNTVVRIIDAPKGHFNYVTPINFFPSISNGHNPELGVTVSPNNDSNHPYPWPFKLSWKCPNSAIETIDMSTYVNETYDLIRTYSYYICGRYLDLSILASYSKKYGFPFGTINNNEMGQEAFFYGFRSLHLFLNWQPRKNAEEICRDIVSTLQTELSELCYDVYYLYPLTDFKDMIENDMTFLSHCKWIISEKPRTPDMFPLFNIKISISKDLPIITNGSEEAKIKFLQDAALENLSDYLSHHPPEFSIQWEHHGPVVKAILPNHLINFLFTYLTTSQYNVCPLPSCNKLLMGKKYCSRKHMDAYNKSTEVGKMANMISKWSGTGAIPSELYDLFVQEGKKLLAEEVQYENVKRILKEWQDLIAKVPLDDKDSLDVAQSLIQIWKDQHPNQQIDLYIAKEPLDSLF